MDDDSLNIGPAPLAPGDIYHVPYDRKVVEIIDRLVEIAKTNGSKNTVVTEQDWITVQSIYRAWELLYPEQVGPFYERIRWFRTNEQDKGIGGEKGHKLQHMIEVPRKLDQMLKTFFPKQKWDRKFIKKLVVYLPGLKVTNDASF